MNWTDSLSAGKPLSVDQQAALLRRKGYTEVEVWEAGAWPSPVETLELHGKRIMWCDGREEYLESK